MMSGRTRSISPASHGSFYELYAIAAAVLGGFSLRGGEGLIVGVVLGHLGLKREPHGRGMAIAGLVMNYVSLALLLLAVVFLVILVIAGMSVSDYTST